MAVRNNLFLFAWLCATVVPLGLQFLSGSLEDVRSYLDSYYGGFSLYMFFTMTYGFATVFTAYYQVSSYHRAGTLDLLRVSGITPREVLRGVFLQLQLLLAPPVLGFAVLFAIYTFMFAPDRTQFSAFSPALLVGGGLTMLFNQALLCALMCTGLYRRESPLALLGGLLVFGLNALPVILLYVLHLPVWLYALLMLVLLAGLLALALANLTRMWPPQQRIRKGV